MLFIFCKFDSFFCQTVSYVLAFLLRGPASGRREAYGQEMRVRPLSFAVGIGYAFYDYDEETGLNVLEADELKRCS